MTIIKKIIPLILSLTLTILISGCESGLPYETEEKLYGTHKATILIKDYGTIELELYGDVAPVTVANFVKLAKQGFYDSLTFHRAIAGFMIQGGDPNGDGTGDSARRIYGEFKENGFENNLMHTRGVISMARTNDYNSASCQFFIMLDSAEHLDGNYAAFGKVTSGMEIIDEVILNIGTVGENGEVAPENQPIIEKIEILE